MSIATATKPHFHVCVGMSGYLPNANYYADTLGQAIEIAKEEKAAYREMGYVVRGDIRKHRAYEVGDGWQYITIEECQEPDCSEEDW